MRSPIRLDPRDLGGGRGAQLFAAVGEHHQPGPGVGRVGFPRDVASCLQLVDEGARRLLGHPGLLGEIGDADALAVEALADPALGQRQIVEACGPHGLDHAGFGGAMRNEHQKRGVRFIGHDSSIG